MTLIPSAGEDSPHTGIIRINWEIFPTNQNGTYSNNMPVDIGVILLKTNATTFEECKNIVEAYLNKSVENDNFVHIWKRGSFT